MTAAEWASRLVQLGKSERHRSVILLSGSVTWQRHTVAEMFAKKSVTVVSNQTWSVPLAERETVGLAHADRLLGAEVDHLLLDASEGYHATALGITSGCVRAGGLFVIIAPDTVALSCSGFDEYCDHILRTSQHVFQFNEEQTLNLPASIETDNIPAITDNSQQQRAVDAICRVVNGHRKRPAVLVADRGRGKSAALGIAASTLFDQGLSQIIVTGRSRRAAYKVFDHCISGEPTWCAVEKLVLEKPACDLLLIDEAASLPITILTQLLEAYPRIAMATTVHGYEGTGQGFMLRFAPILDAKTRGWHHITLQTPIRWNLGDPLESLINRLLVQDADLPVLGDQTLTPEKSAFEKIDPLDLGKNEPLLREIYSLLSLAHYQTRPSDLAQLLNNAALRIYRLTHQETTIGVALVVIEGGLDNALGQQVFQGKRRPEGHVLPEILASQLGQPDAVILQYARIMRIVIHPTLQRQGFGRHLITQIRAQLHSTVDFIGSHFSATPGLTQFWRKQGFEPIRIGQSRSVKTAGHSAVVLMPESTRGERVALQANADFAVNFPIQLSTTLSDIEPASVIALIQGNKGFAAPPGPEVVHQLAGFGLGQRSADTLPGALLQFAVYGLYLGKLSLPFLWVEKILMARNWSDCRDCSGTDGWKSGNKMLRDDVLKVMQSHLPQALRQFKE